MWHILGVASANDGPTWNFGPNERGTLQILSSCIVTLVLCVSTVLHLNIPEHKKAPQQYILKFGWVCLGLFAPEVFVVTALRQKIEAHRLTTSMQALFKDLTPPGPRGLYRNTIATLQALEKKVWTAISSIREVASDEPYVHHDRKYAWTSIHSHYAIMGGFAFDTKHLEHNFFPGGRTRLTLTSKGLIELVKVNADLLPDISVDFIKDKSKASTGAKVVVCLQAFGFCIKTLSRMGSRYPISVLELNTFAHAFCCLLIYLLWWSKPLNIDQPSLIPLDSQDDQARKLSAAMCMHSSIGMFKQCTNPSLKVLIEYDRTPQSNNEATLQIHDSTKLEVNMNMECREDTLVATTIASTKESPDSPSNTIQDLSCPPIGHYCTTHSEATPELRRYEQCYRFTFRYVYGKVMRFIDVGAGPENNASVSVGYVEHISEIDDVSISLDASSIECMKLANEFMASRPESFPLSQKLNLADDLLYTDESFFPRPQEYLKIRATNLPLNKTHGTATWLGLAMCSGMYGGFHLLAWNGPFHSNISMLLWRISGLTIVSPAVLALLVLIYSALDITSFKRPVVERIDTNVRRMLRWSEDRFFTASSRPLSGAFWCWLVFWIWLCTYTLARGFIIAECFISLPYLSDGVFELHQWEQYIPQLSCG